MHLQSHFALVIFCCVEASHSFHTQLEWRIPCLSESLRFTLRDVTPSSFSSVFWMSNPEFREELVFLSVGWRRRCRMAEQGEEQDGAQGANHSLGVSVMESLFRCVFLCRACIVSRYFLVTAVMWLCVNVMLSFFSVCQSHQKWLANPSQEASDLL